MVLFYFYLYISASLLSKKTQDSIDAVVFTIGVQTFLRQFSNDIFNNYITHLCKYVLSFVSSDRYKFLNKKNFLIFKFY